MNAPSSISFGIFVYLPKKDGVTETAYPCDVPALFKIILVLIPFLKYP